MTGKYQVSENRAGAGGVVGTDVVAKSSPDGYTLLVTYAAFTSRSESVPKMPFDSIKDFQTVATLAVTPFVLIVHPALPAKNLAEFIALAKAKPGVLTYASSGNGSVNHLLGEMLKADTGISILHVPYRGRGSGHYGRRQRTSRRSVQQCPLRPADGPKWKCSRPCRQQREAHRNRTGHSDNRRAGSSGVRRQPLVGHPGAGGNRHGDCAQDQPGCRQHPAHQGDDRIPCRSGR